MVINLGHPHSELCEGISVYIHPHKMYIVLPFKILLVLFIK